MREAGKGEDHNMSLRKAERTMVNEVSPPCGPTSTEHQHRQEPEAGETDGRVEDRASSDLEDGREYPRRTHSAVSTICKRPTGPVTIIPSEPPLAPSFPVVAEPNAADKGHKPSEDKTGGFTMLVTASESGQAAPVLLATPENVTPGAFAVGGRDSISSRGTTTDSSRRAIGPVELDESLPIAGIVVPDTPTAKRRTVLKVAASILVVVSLVIAVTLGVLLATKDGGGPTGPPIIENKSTMTQIPQIGNDILPRQAGVPMTGIKFGSTVSMNGDGTRVAVGAPGNLEQQEDGTMIRRGFVEVMELDDSVWRPMGSQIRVDSREGQAGALAGKDVVRNSLVVTMSREGNCLAFGVPLHADDAGAEGIGRVEVFKLTSNQWERMGNAILGTVAGDFAGASISVAKEDCGIVAIGSPGHDSGNGGVFVYQLIGETWISLHGLSPIVSESSFRLFGGSVSLSDDGKVLAIGSSSDANVLSTVVNVYRFRSGSWTEVGTDGRITGGKALYDTSWNAEISADGTRVVMSNYYTGDNETPLPEEDGTNTALVVRAFSIKNDKWQSIGSNMHVNATGAKSGYFISLSDDGNVIGMGDPGSQRSDGSVSGHAHIYKYNGVDWRQAGPDIDGEASGDMFGFFVSVSGNGKYFAAGAPSNRFRGFEHGQVKVYDISS